MATAQTPYRGREELFNSSGAPPETATIVLAAVLKKFLNEHLPQRFRAGSGFVIDVENRVSLQQDVIVYDALSSPLYRYAEKTQIVPFEAVAAVIEVKSTLTKDILRDAYEKIASCKKLKKRPLTMADRDGNRPGMSTGTNGFIFAFDSPLTLETLADHIKELNEQYQSDLWPDMTVVVGRGVLAYGLRYPGSDASASSFLSVAFPEDTSMGSPPWAVHLVVYSDGEFALNRFFMNLLTQLNFYPYRSGVPSFDKLLEGNPKVAMFRTAYQFNLAHELKPVPDHHYKTDTNNPVSPAVIIVTKGTSSGAIFAFIPWQDGSIIRTEGAPELIQAVFRIVLKSNGRERTQIVHDPSQGGVGYTTLTTITEEEFRRWPKAIESRLNYLKARLTTPSAFMPTKL